MSSNQYFNGNIIADNATVKNRLQIGNTGSFTAGNNSLLLNQSLIPTNSEVYLGSVENPFRSIYVNTGSVFIGPTGSFQINSNGLIASTEGFAAPFYQVGAISPGQGILLYEENNILYFADQIGNTGAVSVFNITPGSQFDTYYSLPGNVGFGVTGPQYKLDVLGNIHASDTILATSFSGTNLHISSVESTNSTLNIATSSNTNTVNIGTSNSIQTLNLGTVGTGQTTINIGGVGDTVNVAGNLVYVNSSVTEISNPQFIINQSGTNINNTGLTVSQNGGPTGAYILVNSSSNAWTLKAGVGNLVTLNQDVSNGANVTFGTATLSNAVLNADTISLGTNSNAQTNSVGIGYQTLQSSSGPYAVAIGYQTAQIGNTGGYSVALGYKAGQTTQGENTIAVGYESGLIAQGRYSLAMGPQSGRTNQGQYGISLGYQSGYDSQSTNSIAIGNASGRTTQGTNSVAIGNGAGYNNQGQYSIAIGNGAGNTNQSNNSIILNAQSSNLDATVSGLFVNPVRNTTGPNFVYYNPTTKEVTQSNVVVSSNVNTDVITTNLLNFGSIGSVYFQTGSATGCYITKMNYNTTGVDHYVYYNSTTKELTQSSPAYFFSYSTGTQRIATASNSSTGYFQPVTFNANNILYHTFQHTSGSSIFTGTFMSPVTLQLEYNIQFHSTDAVERTAAAILYLDGTPIRGSYRSCSMTDNNAEYSLTNTVIVNIPNGGHTIELRAAGTSTSIYIGGTPNIFAPDSTYTSANLCCTRII